MLDHDAPPSAPLGLPRYWRRLTASLAWMPLAVLVVALAAGIVSKVMEPPPAPSTASSLRWMFITHPTCPECAELEAATRRTPAIEVLDWSKSADRATFRQLISRRVVRENERVTLPMLVAVAPNGTTLQWVGAPKSHAALVASGLWARDPFPRVQFAIAFAAIGLGVLAGRWLLPTAGWLLLVGSFGALGTLGDACTDCAGAVPIRSVGLVAAGLAGCLFTWYLLERTREGSVQAVLLPVVLSTLVGGQLALILEDPRFCAGCAVFLAAIATTAGCCATAPFAPSADRGLLARNGLRVGFAACGLTFVMWAGAALTHEPARGVGPPTDPDAIGRARQEAQGFVGRASASFLVLRGQPVSASETVMVLGAPGCPPCEAAFEHLSGAVESPVIFVRPADDVRDISGLWPFPAKTSRSEYRCTKAIHTAPITLVTDSNGKVVWARPLWPSRDDDVDEFVNELMNHLNKGREK